MKWIAGLGLALGLFVWLYPGDRWGQIAHIAAIGCGGIAAWGLTSDTILHNPYAPHRMGAWALRGFWAVAIGTTPFLSFGWGEPLQAVCTLLGFAMGFSFLSRLHRAQQQHKAGSICEVVAVFVFALGLVIWSGLKVELIILHSASIGVCIVGCSAILTLPTSEAQRSDGDHHTSA